MISKSTHFRWFIISLLFLLNGISYIDRSALAYAVDPIIQTLHLNFFEIGAMLGAFGIGYLITTFFGGIIVDRYGARITILICSLIWGVAIGGTGAATGFIGLYLARFCLGLGEGPNFPAVARTVSDWLPEQTRAKALANALVAVPISLAMGAPIVSFLIVTTSWRWMFIILGFIVFLWLPFWWIFYRDKPSESRFVNETEKNYIESRQKAKPTQEQIKTPWRFFFKNPTILSNNWAFFVYGYSMFFYLSWLPEFLEKSYHLNIKQVGLFAFLPWSLAALGLWGVGYLSDFILKKTGNLRYARSYPIMIGQLFSLLCILPILFWHNVEITLIMLSLAVAFNLSNNTTFYAINVDVIPHRAASSLGLMNSGFAIAGFLAPVITGWLVEMTNSFQVAFILMALMTVSAILGVFIFHHPDKHLRMNE